MNHNFLLKQKTRMKSGVSKNTFQHLLQICTICTFGPVSFGLINLWTNEPSARCLSFCPFFPLTIVLSVLLRLTDSYYPFGIFKLFWLQQRNLTKIISLIYVYKTVEQLLKIQILVDTDDINGWNKQDIIESQPSPLHILIWNV